MGFWSHCWLLAQQCYRLTSSSSLIFSCKRGAPPAQMLFQLFFSLQNSAYPSDLMPRIYNVHGGAGMQETISNCQDPLHFWVSDWLSSPRYWVSVGDSVGKEISKDLCHLVEFLVISSWALFKNSFRISDVCKPICANTYVLFIALSFAC